MRNISVVLFMSVLVLLCGCASGPTRDLIESVTIYDSPPARVISAYYSNDQVIVDYQIGMKEHSDGTRAIPGGRFWASLSTAPNISEPELPRPKYVSIHRESILTSSVEGLRPLQVRDISKEITVDVFGRHRKSDYNKYINSISKDELPMIVYATRIDMITSISKIEEGFCSLVSISANTGTRVIDPINLQSSYIPAKYLPRLILMFPLAFILSIQGP